jgi:hypothetical protein
LEKTIGEERRCQTEAIGVVDILQVLEGAAYVGFIAGAIFAVMELRTLSRDRKTEVVMRMNEYWASKDFEEAFIKIRELDSEDPRQMEEKCTKQSLWMVVDYLDGIGVLAEDGLLDKKYVINMIAWELIWDRLEPWVIDMRKKVGNPELATGFQYAAKEARRINARQEHAS